MADVMARKPFNPDLINVPAARPRKVGAAPLSVSQVTALVKSAIATGLPSTVHVLGEISNFKRHGSGHLYLTLKDRSSELSCVMWRSAADLLKFNPGDGLEVIATGRVEVFERAGRYQLYIRKLEPRGVGSLELAFRQLCDKLEGEGLFEERGKKPLPRFPARIVLVTSPTGAAVGDMIRTVHRRYPPVSLLVYPVRVQGPGSADEIAAAIRCVNAESDSLGGVDLMIVGRGGGSLEDLWAFNEEVVARAIHVSRIPIVSAVGHEVDVTIADLVADVRAATPTAAAELAVPVLDEVLGDLSVQSSRLRRAIRSRIDVQAARLNGVAGRGVFRAPMDLVRHREQLIDELTARLERYTLQRIAGVRQRVDRAERVVRRIAPHAYMIKQSAAVHELQRRLLQGRIRRVLSAESEINRISRRIDRASPTSWVRAGKQDVGRLESVIDVGIRHRLALELESVRRHDDRLSAMSYRSVLGRGFSITRTRKGRHLVRSLGQLGDGQSVITELVDGEFESRVINLKELELLD